MPESHTFIISKDESGERLDLYLSKRLPSLTRSGLKRAIKEGLVTIDNTPVLKASRRIRAGEMVVTQLVEKTPETELTPDALKLDILYEDDSIIVLNKPAGLSVHPGAGRKQTTLAGALLFHTNDLSRTAGQHRPGIVHRLDKDTTGVMIVAKTDRAHENLCAQFKAHSTLRRYHAVVWGIIKEDSGRIDLPIGRSPKDRKKISTTSARPKEATTLYRVLRRFKWFTLVELSPRTGRTHQIRVHLLAINHPVVSDPLYGRRKIPSCVAKPQADIIKGIKRQNLHALSLGFKHPETGEYMEFSAPYPPDMLCLIEELKRSESEQ